MIDRQAIYIINQYSKYQKYVDDFYHQLLEYSKNQETTKIESSLDALNLCALKLKTRPVYYNQKCLKTDLDKYIVEEYRLMQKRKNR